MSTHACLKPYQCNVCQKQFSRKDGLKRHVLTHTDIKEHQCEVCKKAFRDPSNLRGHMLTHSGFKPHQCDLCQKQFYQKYRLKQHILTHTSVKPHQCGVCNKEFSDPSNLKKHMLTHSGIKSHMCDVCMRQFSRKDVLKRHILTHKSLHCNVCKKQFTCLGDLKQHHASNHHDFKAVYYNMVKEATQAKEDASTEVREDDVYYNMVKEATEAKEDASTEVREDDVYHNMVKEATEAKEDASTEVREDPSYEVKEGFFLGDQIGHLNTDYCNVDNIRIKTEAQSQEEVLAHAPCLIESISMQSASPSGETHRSPCIQPGEVNVKHVKAEAEKVVIQANSQVSFVHVLDIKSENIRVLDTV